MHGACSTLGAIRDSRRVRRGSLRHARRRASGGRSGSRVAGPVACLDGREAAPPGSSAAPKHTTTGIPIPRPQ